eukprot:2138329-Pyramimonas_sp.AAC.1
MCKGWSSLGHAAAWDFDRVADASAGPRWRAACEGEGPAIRDIQTGAPDCARKSSRRRTTKSTPAYVAPPMTAPGPTAGGQLQ